MTNPFELTATDAIKLIGNNKLSRYEWVQSCFERIREKEDLVKAWIYLDEDRALEKAVRIGKGKKPKLCGKKCKAKIAKKVGSSFTGADGSVGYKLDKKKFKIF